MNSRKMIAAVLTAALLTLGGLSRLAAQSSAFRYFGPLGRVITPNGDQKNDMIFFCFDNFADSGVVGRVFTLLGSEVASMTQVRTPLPGCPGGNLPQYMTWDGRTSEGTVSSGMYVYRIEAEGKTYTGTLLVVR